ncbi:aspartate aminotransferase family protein [Janthinobacterium fluminis]|uniref:Aminotransferase class III-fold pyridoxal phosphate-dependent enzyme n=1 Tax=Janthinobacterium fluminis TaxID=2987524 RepID=A0ABT5K1T5_9BURK|nr:aminotransferase class III-fold pyridoxal phosphate-dependent enzyme [Janthinobacterium fluminis]MDC8758930.1 aminotransferase class III-fold pyridoxal phosphate-dependent enzyme [Janthinobacterium fluminis]
MTSTDLHRPMARLNLNLSKKYLDRCIKYYPGGSHFNFATPQRPLNIPFKRGEGARVWDLDNNEHIDFFNKFGALFLGHNHPQYLEAMIGGLKKATAVDMCDMEVEVAEALLARYPSADQVRFCLSGTEAVQNAIRLARGYTGKQRFVRFSGHYHGNADNIIGGYPGDTDFPTPKMKSNDVLNTKGRADGVLEAQSFLLQWNDAAVLQSTLEKYSGEIAAVIMEPFLVNGGGIAPAPGYLEQVRALCTKHNVLLIFDEVITGFRAGIGGAQGLYGIKPDITILGKALGGGSMPVSAVLSTKEIMSLYADGKVIFGGTFNGYTMGLVAVKACLTILQADTGCYERVEGHMKKIGELLVAAADDNDIPMFVQGLPNALTFHVDDVAPTSADTYSNKNKMLSNIIRETSKRFGIQFCPISRMYSNIMLNDSDVAFFGSRIGDAMQASKAEIDKTLEEFSKFGIK